MNPSSSALRKVIKVLNANNLRNRLRRLKLLRGNSTQPNMPYQALLLQLDKRSQRLFKRLVLRRSKSAQTQIHHIQRIQPKIPQIVMHRIDNLLPRASMRPRSIARRAALPPSSQSPGPSGKDAAPP